MADVSALVDRIHKEFSDQKARLQQARERHLAEHHARQVRQKKLEGIFEDLRKMWRPRLETLAREFGDRIHVTPRITPGRRIATFNVKSPLASIQLTFSASADSDVTELVLTYDLQILPILMKFERHAELSMPLDEVNAEKAGDWLDDRIVGFVQTYLEMQSNEYYLKDQMVDDPVVHVRFPKFAAEATRERGGKTHYFISEATAAEFDQPATG